MLYTTPDFESIPLKHVTYVTPTLDSIQTKHVICVTSEMENIAAKHTIYKKTNHLCRQTGQTHHLHHPGFADLTGQAHVLNHARTCQSYNNPRVSRILTDLVHARPSSTIHSAREIALPAIELYHGLWLRRIQ